MAEKNPRAPRASKRTGSSRRAGAGGPATPESSGSMATAASTTGAQDSATAAPPPGDAEAGAEPIVFAERITVIAETPLAGDDAGIAARAEGPGATKPVPAGITAEQRYLMIAERAYERARQRGFAPGGELEDWLIAEQEIDARLAGS